MDLKKRLKKVHQRLEKNHLDAFLVSNFYNLDYLAGFTGLSNEEREAWLSMI